MPVTRRITRGRTRRWTSTTLAKRICAYSKWRLLKDGYRSWTTRSTLGTWVCKMLLHDNFLSCGWCLCSVCRWTNSRSAKRTFTCISTSCFSLYLDRFLPSICSSEWSSTTSTSRRRRPAAPSRCSWRRIRRSITMPWRKWAIRNLWKPFRDRG